MYVKGYHGWLLKRFDAVSEEERKAAIQTIYKVYEIMRSSSPARIEEEGTVILLSDDR